MNFWNINITIEGEGEKNIDVHEDPSISLENMIERLIAKYHGEMCFFLTAIKKMGTIYITDDTTVTMMNDNLTIIEFDTNPLSSVKTIRIAKRKLYLFNNIL